MTKLRGWLFDNRWLLTYVLVAFAVRLHWNLHVHPPGDYIYSDMGGYVSRADGLFRDTWRPVEYFGFYPYGTHVLLFALKWALGKGNYVGLGVAYAVLGTGVVGYGYALALRVSAYRWVAPIVGAILVCYYPLIGLGGYFLSEIPFSFCLTAGTFYLIRVVDDGRVWDALVAGIIVAAGFTFRPQILLSVAFVGVYGLFVHRHLRHASIRLALVALVPVLSAMVFSAWRLHHHTGRMGIISENGTFNQVFGRCHNNKIVANPDKPSRRRTAFGPPALIQLEKRGKRRPQPWPVLDPAFEVKFEYRGYIGDKDILKGYIARCIEKTGWLKQIEYSFVNVLLLWRFNVMWPDSGKGHLQPYARRWGLVHLNVFAIPALLGLAAFVRPRKFAKLALVSMHLWALIVVAALYIGGKRFRAPYDPVLILMAIEVYSVGIVSVVSWWRRRKSRDTSIETDDPPDGSNDSAAVSP